MVSSKFLSRVGRLYEISAKTVVVVLGATVLRASGWQVRSRMFPRSIYGSFFSPMKDEALHEVGAGLRPGKALRESALKQPLCFAFDGS